MMMLSFNDDFILYRKPKTNKDFVVIFHFFLSTYLVDKILPHTFVSTQQLVQFPWNMLAKTNVFAFTTFTCDLLFRRYVMCRSSQDCFRIMTTILYAFLTAPMHATFPVHHILHEGLL